MRWGQAAWGARIDKGGAIWDGFPTRNPVQINPGLEPRALVQASRPAVKLVIYDNRDNLIGQISSNAQHNTLGTGKFELLPTGCGALDFSLSDKPSYPLPIGTRVDVYLYNQTAPVYSGFLQTSPWDGVTQNERRLSGFGYSDRLTAVLLSGPFYNWQTSDIVSNLIQFQIGPSTGIELDPTQIVPDGYQTQALVFVFDDPTSIWPQLDLLAGGYFHGVDELRRFFFKPQDPVVRENLWHGKHFEDCTDETDGTSLCNSYLLQLANVRTDLAPGDFLFGTNYCPPALEDSASIAQYGRYQQVLNLPSTFSQIDGARMAGQLLEENSQPAHHAEVKTIFFNGDLISGSGQMTIHGQNGAVLTLPKARITYNWDGSRVWVDAELGQRRLSPSDLWSSLYNRQGLDGMSQQVSQAQVLAASRNPGA